LPNQLTVIDRRQALSKALQAERAAGRTVGLVPTMGSLHRGHTSLMRRAATECDVVVATLFVNPLQFGPTEDLATYPRDPAGDRDKAAAAGVAILFAPSQEEMFPVPPVTTVAVGGLSDILEGTVRPGHLQGVATIVTKLLSLAGSCRAYFGEKDYQQLAVIRRLVTDLSLPAEIVACPTVRDDDGLALSSRNAYLTAAQRAIAPALHQALQAGQHAATGTTSAAAVRAAMVALVGEHPEIALDYAEVADPEDLTALTTVEGDARLLIAARLGRTRLIDNVSLLSPT
jgi:pantoate--beta-alanine ligase